MVPPSLGSTALVVWQTWRALPWQGLPVYGHVAKLGEFCWQPNRLKPAGFELHRVLNELATRPATAAEEDVVWTRLLAGQLEIYTRRNNVGGSKTPVHLLHRADNTPMLSGLKGLL